MGNRWTGSYDDDKYGEKDVTWINRDDDGTVEQYNVKDVETGNHYFVDLKDGTMGVALGDYRPERDDD